MSFLGSTLFIKLKTQNFSRKNMVSSNVCFDVFNFISDEKTSFDMWGCSLSVKIILLDNKVLVSDSQVIWGYRKVAVSVKYYQRGSFSLSASNSPGVPFIAHLPLIFREWLADFSRQLKNDILHLLICAYFEKSSWNSNFYKFQKSDGAACNLILLNVTMSPQKYPYKPV